MSADFESLILGAAVGDALGLPAEGLRPEQIRKRWKGVWKMRLVFGRGMFSDDTEHLVMVSLCLLSHPANVVAFQRELARRMRWWFAALPAGIGLATARACIKLWLGFSPNRSGVFSAGNGPAMRSAIIGAFFAHEPEHLVAYVRASTWLTHTDPKAEVAARAIAEAAAWEVRMDTQDELWFRLTGLSQEGTWIVLMDQIKAGLSEGLAVPDFAARLNLQRGISGYAYHTVPMALYTWLRHRGEFKTGLEALLNCGGDTDTVGAIAGALLGLSCGEAQIPADWIDSIKDWPLSVSQLRKMAKCIEVRGSSPFRWWHWLAIPFRNLCLLAIVFGSWSPKTFLAPLSDSSKNLSESEAF